METVIRNAFGKRVKRRMFVITRADPLLPRPYCTYLCKNGFRGYQLERAATFKTEGEAEKEAEYFRATYPRFTWHVEAA